MNSVHRRSVAIGALAAVLLGLEPGIAADDLPPAVVEFEVRDLDGKPIEGARISVWDHPESSWTSDAAGKARVEVPVPSLDEVRAPAFAWNSPGFTVEAPGFARDFRTQTLFPKARFREKVALVRSSDTRIRFLLPDGSPAAGLPILLGQEGDSVNPLWAGDTDGKGEVVFRHAANTAAIRVLVQDPAVTGPVDRRDRWARFVGRMNPGPAVEVRLTPEDMKPAPSWAFPRPRRVLEGRVLDAEGRPASGWRVQGGMAWFGAAGCLDAMENHFLHGLPSTGTVWSGPNGEFRVEVEVPWGGGEVPLGLVSPEGVALLYGLAPSTWPEGTRQVILRLPPRRRNLTGHVVDEDGRPVAGVEIVPDGTVPGPGATWHVPVEDAPGSTGGAFRFVRTDGDGKFVLPLLLGQRPSSVALRAPGYQNGALWEGGDGEAVLRKTDSARRAVLGEAARWRRLLVRVLNTDGGIVEGATVGVLDAFRGKTRIGNSGGWEAYPDSDGVHMWIPPDRERLDRIEVQVTAKGWKEVRTVLSPTQDKDQVTDVCLVEREVAPATPTPAVASPPDAQDGPTLPPPPVFREASCLRDELPVAGVDVRLYVIPDDGKGSPIPISRDLSDAKGQVRLPLRQGSRHLVVARDHGRSLGWVEVPSRGKPRGLEGEVPIVMRPVGRLVVRPHFTPGTETFPPVTITWNGLEPAIGAAVSHAIGRAWVEDPGDFRLAPGSRFPVGLDILSGHDGGYEADDLPTGIDITVATFDGRKVAVTVLPGQVPQVVEIARPTPPK